MCLLRIRLLWKVIDLKQDSRVLFDFLHLDVVIHLKSYLSYVLLLAEDPGIALEIFCLNFDKKNSKLFFFLKKNAEIYLANVTSRAPMGSLNKFRAIRSSRLACYGINIYERRASLYRLFFIKKSNSFAIKMYWILFIWKQPWQKHKKRSKGWNPLFCLVLSSG